jgi:single-strand DNA-binding protein
MNSCNFVGRLTANPELKKTNNDISVCRFTLAVSRPRVKDITDFINFTAWRQSAEYLTNYGRKGMLVAVSGSLNQNNYEDKDGNKRTSYEVVADTLKLCESRSNSNNENVPSETQNSSQNENNGFVEVALNDDLPF